MTFLFISQPDFACNPHALWRYIQDHTDHQTAWLVKTPAHCEALQKRGLRCAVYNTLEGARLAAEADYVVMNTYTFDALEKRAGQIFVNLWHGSGVKAHDYYYHDMDPRQAAKLERVLRRTDLMCVHSLDDRFRLSAMLHYDLRRSYVTGQARLDCVKTSDGKAGLVRLLGRQMEAYRHIVFYAPSFRANSSGHSGTFFSDNIFRLPDYDDGRLDAFLQKHDAALVYKLHPIEQTAFSGREFRMNGRCFALTDDMLFGADLRIDELLNAFDVMMSDYSSIAFDFLPLDRPLVYLIPDRREYQAQKGFVFHDVDPYMPGPKAYDFSQMLQALEEAFTAPERYKAGRDFVISQRFDYTDDNAAKRCYQQITHYTPPSGGYTPYRSSPEIKMPSAADQLRPFAPGGVFLIDSTRDYSQKEKAESLAMAGKLCYITSEIPGPYRKLTRLSCAEIADLPFYQQVRALPNAEIKFVQGGVDYRRFSAAGALGEKAKKRIGFAGTIDGRIYFAMVQCICEVFADCEVVFAGDIYGDYPVWLNGFDNLRYQAASYAQLPEIIASFDVALLPYYDHYQKTVPDELFQYLACGKQVVASDMPNLPDCPAIYRSRSVADAVENVKTALARAGDTALAQAAREEAQKHTWEQLARQIFAQ